MERLESMSRMKGRRGGALLLTKAAERMVEQELSDAKKASILIGVRTKDEQFISGSIHDDPHNDDLGNAVFEIGSTTKTFTSLLLAKCILANKVSLDEPVASYKPEYKRALTHNGKEVTFRNLSTHLSGLPREDMKTIRHSVKKIKMRVIIRTNTSRKRISINSFSTSI